MQGATRIAQIEAVIRDWLDEPEIALFCGDWRTGSIMELLPRGRAVLTASKYPEPFDGLRDITLPDQEHHLHIDLAKLRTAVYVMAPCVCFGYRPSFEVRFSDDEGAVAAFSLGPRRPYLGKRANRAAIVPYFRRMLDHHARLGDVVRFRIEARKRDEPEDWRDVYECWLEAGGPHLALAIGAPNGAPLGPDALRRAVGAALGSSAHA